MPKESIHNLILSLSKQLNIEGIFGFNLIGHNDDWALKGSDIPVSVLNKEEIISLLAEAGLQVISLTEHEYDAALADGSMKHWHEFRVIGQNIDSSI